MMLSVCIPVYNYDATPLARSLVAQASAVADGMELVCIDDASAPEWRERNAQLAQWGQYVQLDHNVGRARIRNMFLDHSSGDYLLFLDVDSEVGEGFLARYVKVLQEGRPAVVVGGRVYDRRGDNRQHRLRYLYGTRVESKPAAWRRAHPYRSFMSNNFVVRRDVFGQLPFDERISRYGHEDTLFGYRLEQSGIPITHIDNPVVNGEVESNEVFLDKTREGVLNLADLDRMLDDDGFRSQVHLLSTFYRLQRQHLTGLVHGLYRPLRRPLERRLASGRCINVCLFNFYKLGFFIQSKHKQNN